jgi:hypothetical protein
MFAQRKKCRTCRKRLSLAAFNGSARTLDGLADRCRSCTNARRRELALHRQEGAPRDSIAAVLRRGDVKKMRALLGDGAKPHWSWICETMHSGGIELARMLLDQGIEPNVFTMAALADYQRLKRHLRSKSGESRRTADFEPACRGVTPLHVACAAHLAKGELSMPAEQVKSAGLLSDCGADIDAAARYRGIDEATPLFCACWSSGNLQLVHLLLERGATARDCDLLAALGHFQRHQHAAFDIAEVLLAHGVPVDGSIRGDRTALQACAHQGAFKTVAWLLARGADVNARGPGGRTAAHFAAERNTGPRTLELLCRDGADLGARDLDGRTPLDLAVLNGKTRVAAWLTKNRRRTK